MKTATVRQIQHSLKSVLTWVDAGETVTVTRRNSPVAEIGPPRHLGARRRARPDFGARLKEVFPHPLPGGTNAERIAEERNHR